MVSSSQSKQQARIPGQGDHVKSNPLDRQAKLWELKLLVVQVVWRGSEFETLTAQL